MELRLEMVGYLATVPASGLRLTAGVLVFAKKKLVWQPIERGSELLSTSRQLPLASQSIGRWLFVFAELI